jgi:hypothetical protein
MSLFLAHARNRLQGQGPCGCGEEEVLRHGSKTSYSVRVNQI